MRLNYVIALTVLVATTSFVTDSLHATESRQHWRYAGTLEPNQTAGYTITARHEYTLKATLHPSQGQANILLSDSNGETVTTSLPDSDAPAFRTRVKPDTYMLHVQSSTEYPLTYELTITGWPTTSEPDKTTSDDEHLEKPHATHEPSRHGSFIAMSSATSSSSPAAGDGPTGTDQSSTSTTSTGSSSSSSSGGGSSGGGSGSGTSGANTSSSGASGAPKESESSAGTRIVRGGSGHTTDDHGDDAPAIIFYDATRYDNKPDDPLPGTDEVYYFGRGWTLGSADEHGNRPPEIRDEFWNDYLNRPPEGATIIFNLEASPLYETGQLRSNEDVEMAEQLVENWIKALHRVRQIRPDAEIGTYGRFPFRHYHAAVRYAKDPGDPDHAQRYHKWDRTNTLLAEAEVEIDGKHYTVGDLIDFVSPSLYEFYPRPDDWKLYARIHIEQARKYSDDVRPFIWPQAHPSRREDLFEGKGYLSKQHWRTIVQVCIEEQVDPIIWSARRDWDQTARRWHRVLLEELDHIR